MNNQILQLLGMAMRAGAVATGDETCLAKVRSGQALVTFLANDAGHNTQKKYRDKCATYRVPLIESFSKTELGVSLGKIERVVAVVTHNGFADRILQLSKEQIGGERCE